MNNTLQKKSVSAVSVQVFGEKTSNPIAVSKAVIQATDPLPFLNKSLVSLELHLVNKTVKKDNVSAKLQLTLPMGATVKKFELFRDEKWYPATSVPKKKAKAVVYKEKEKGRAVAAVSNATAATNCFEMEISPLPFEKAVPCCLEIIVEGSAQELVESLQSNETEMVVEKVAHDSTLQANNSDAGAIVGESFGKTHFVCKIPSVAMPANASPNKLDHVAIIWDASASTAKSTGATSSRLEELLTKANTQTVELYTFGMGAPQKLGLFGAVDDLVAAIKGIKHDGGTDLTTLPTLVKELALDSTMDAVLVFTDGVDNLGRSPVFDNTTNIPFPVHCIAPKNVKTINMRMLQTIAAASANVMGAVLTQKDDNYLKGILHPQPVLHSIVVDQNEQAFVEELDDGFRCTPDHRLQVLNQPIPAEGLLITGILGDSTVTKLTANIQMGPNKQAFQFELRKEQQSITDDASCPTLFLESKKDNKADPAARILGHVYAEQLYHQAVAFGIRSGLSTERVREELAVKYGFCSPESTLLMLYSKEQFNEHDIAPPEGHPIAGEIPAVGDSNSKKTYPAGEVGGVKNEKQVEHVVQLAQRLKTFFTEKIEAPQVKKRSSQRRLLQCARFSRPATHAYHSEEGCDEEDFLDDDDDGECEEECAPAPLDAETIARYNAEIASAAAAPLSDDDDGEVAEQCVVSESQQSQQSCRVRDGCARPGVAPGAHQERESSLFSGCAPPGGGKRHRRVSVECRPECATACSSLSQGAPADQAGAASVSLSAPSNPKQYLELFEAVLAGDDSGDWVKLYEKELATLGGHESASPSFFLNSARVLIQHGKPDEALCVAANCLESGIDDVQMLRSVGYLFLSSNTPNGMDLAAALFLKVKELAPLEPQSYMDVALTGYYKAWKAFGTLNDANSKDKSAALIREELARVQEQLVHVLTYCWAQRFQEIEWAALILLHYVSDLAKQTNLALSANTNNNIVEWPVEIEDLCCADFDAPVMIWLGWDTDKTDVDLHVVEPCGKEVYFSSMRGTGSLLSKDFTQGYGPEVYITRGGHAAIGDYQVYANYYASHQDSALTGATSAVVWKIESVNEVKKEVKFQFCRLDTHKQKTHVGTAVCHEGPPAKKRRMN